MPEDDTFQTSTEGVQITSPVRPSFHTLHRYTSQSLRHARGGIRYTRLLADCIYETHSAIDPFSDLTYKPQSLSSSVVMNSIWSADEKERFFTALARCGKGNLPEVSRRVGSKSLAEVVVYIGLLDEQVAMRKESSRRHSIYDYAKVPAATEVDQHWLAFEEKKAMNLGRRDDNTHATNTSPEVEDTVLNSEMTEELAGWYFPCLLF
jgi:hypothetical protein